MALPFLFPWETCHEQCESSPHERSVSRAGCHEQCPWGLEDPDERVREVVRIVTLSLITRKERASLDEHEEAVERFR